MKVIYQTMLHAYSQAQYAHLLRAFASVTFYPSLANEAGEGALCVIAARKAS